MDVWELVVTAVASGAVGWFGNAYKFRSDRKQKEAELDQKDAELAQTKQRDAFDRAKAQEERDLELIDKARELLKSNDEDDKQAGRHYLMGLIRVQEERSAVVIEILDQFAYKEFGGTVAQIRAADSRDEDYVVVLSDSVAIRSDVVADGTTLEDGGTSGDSDGDDGPSGTPDDVDAGEGRGDVEGQESQGHPSDLRPGEGRSGPARA